jgi:hypothetical protein
MMTGVVESQHFTPARFMLASRRIILKGEEKSETFP